METKPCLAEPILGNIKQYLHFWYFCNTEMAHVVRIHPDDKKHPFIPYFHMMAGP